MWQDIWMLFALLLLKLDRLFSRLDWTWWNILFACLPKKRYMGIFLAAVRFLTLLCSVSQFGHFQLIWASSGSLKTAEGRQKATAVVGIQQNMSDGNT